MLSPNVRCPCHEKRQLIETNGALACSGETCPHRSAPHLFEKLHDAPVLVSYERTDTLCSPVTNDVSERQFAGNPSSFMKAARRLVYGRSVTSRRNCDRFVELVKLSSASPSILVIGAGAKGEGTEGLWDDPTLHKTGIDIYVSPTVDYVADAHFLPFADTSFDGVWIQAVLEHVVSPEQVAQEIRRVLKPGGIVYAETAFMQQVHGGPYDFSRFTVTGHRFLFRDFAAIDLGGNGGPAQVLAWSVKYLVWSLTRSRKAGIVASAPFFFCARAIDPLIGDSALWDAASGVYFLGRKDGASFRARDLPALYQGLQR